MKSDDNFSKASKFKKTDSISKIGIEDANVQKIEKENDRAFENVEEQYMATVNKVEENADLKSSLID